MKRKTEAILVFVEQREYPDEPIEYKKTIKAEIANVYTSTFTQFKTNNVQLDMAINIANHQLKNDNQLMYVEIDQLRYKIEKSTRLKNNQTNLLLSESM